MSHLRTPGRGLSLRAPPTRGNLVTMLLLPLVAALLPVPSRALLVLRNHHHHYHHHHCLHLTPQQQFGRSASFLHSAQSPSGGIHEQQYPDDDDPRFQDLATALRRMQILQAPPPPSSSSQQDANDESDHFDFNALLPPKNLVQVRPSSIDGAGLGVFARKNIQAGTIVGFYPAHALGVDFDFNSDDDDDSGSAGPSIVCLAANKEDQSYFDRVIALTTTTDEPNNYVHYLMGSRKIGAADFGSAGRLFIGVRPGRALGDQWISHRINDGATVRARSERGMLDYYARSRQRKNCVHVPFAAAPLIATVTTRKVKKNQELFTTYGCLYWTEQMPTSRDGEDGDENDITTSSVEVVTENVLMEAKATAQDIFVAMRSARVTYASQQQELEQRFAKL